MSRQRALASAAAVVLAAGIGTGIAIRSFHEPSSLVTELRTGFERVEAAVWSPYGLKGKIPALRNGTEYASLDIRNLGEVDSILKQRKMAANVGEGRWIGKSGTNVLEYVSVNIIGTRQFSIRTFIFQDGKFAVESISE